MKLSLFLVTLALMGCSTHHGQRKIASEPGDLITRKIQKEISSERFTSDEGLEAFASGASMVLSDLFSGMVMGESDASISIAAPAIPEDMVADLKLKRAFFYVKMKKPKSTMQQMLLGKTISSMNAIDGLQISLNDVEILKYKKSKKTQQYKGSIFVVNTEKKSEARKFFRDHADIGDYIKSISQMKSGLVIEVIDDVIANEKFKEVVTSQAEAMESMGIKEIEMCSELNCLDLSAEEVNLLTLGKEELKFHATVKNKKMPDRSQFDGFVEFELKMQLDGVEEGDEPLK